MGVGEMGVGEMALARYGLSQGCVSFKKGFTV